MQKGKPTNAGMVRKKREFGDHMAQETETSHVAHIVCAMYATIWAYSYLASLVTGDPWFTQCLFYFVMLVLFYVWHWLAHQKFSGRMYKIHMEHHLKNFPPSIFYGRPGTVKEIYGSEVPTLFDLMDPRRSTNFTFAHEGPLYVMLAVALTVARVVVRCSWPTIGCFLLMSVIMGSIGSALHSSFHVKNFQLERFQWYRELRTLHYLHHLGNMQHNYAVLNLGLDYFFRSLALVDPVGKIENPSEAWDDLVDATKKKEDLPPGVTLEQIRLVRQSAGVLSSSLFAALPPTLKVGHNAGSAIKRGYPTVLLRMLMIGFGVWFWMIGASMILPANSQPHSIQHASHHGAEIYDVGLHLFMPLRAYLDPVPNQVYLYYLVNAKMVLSDLLAVIVIAISIMGPTFRPALGGIFALVLRAFSQYMTRFVAEPATVFLGDNSYPCLFASAATSGSFISPHVIVASVFLVESFRFHKEGRASIFVILWRVLAVFALVFQIVVALVLHSNWTFDILIALLLSRYTTMVAEVYTVFIDTVLP